MRRYGYLYILMTLLLLPSWSMVLELARQSNVLAGNILVLKNRKYASPIVSILFRGRGTEHFVLVVAAVWHAP